MVNFDKGDMVLLNILVIETTNNGKGLLAVRDDGGLDSEVQSIHQTFDGEDLYPSIESKAARLCYNIIDSHPFADGNKRTGVLAMLSFLDLNGVHIKYTDQELIDIGFSIAKKELGHEDLLNWVNTHKQKESSMEI